MSRSEAVQASQNIQVIQPTKQVSCCKITTLVLAIILTSAIAAGAIYYAHSQGLLSSYPLEWKVAAGVVFTGAVVTIALFLQGGICTIVEREDVTNLVKEGCRQDVAEKLVEVLPKENEETRRQKFAKSFKKMELSEEQSLYFLETYGKDLSGKADEFQAMTPIFKHCSLSLERFRKECKIFEYLSKWEVDEIKAFAEEFEAAFSDIPFEGWCAILEAGQFDNEKAKTLTKLALFFAQQVPTYKKCFPKDGKSILQRL